MKEEKQGQKSELEEEGYKNCQKLQTKKKLIMVCLKASIFVSVSQQGKQYAWMLM